LIYPNKKPIITIGVKEKVVSSHNLMGLCFTMLYCC